MTALRSDLAGLIKKYDRPGPRYTSYPTALQFRDVRAGENLFDGGVHREAGVSIYVHIPFCESLCWFCACTKVITRSRESADRYLDDLERELDLTLEAMGSSAGLVQQVHWGGGSPSFLRAAQIERLGQMFHSRFSFDSNAECSVEIDPRTMTEDSFGALREAGFQRVSFGVQDVNPKVQEAIHRVQPEELNRRCMDLARAVGMSKINIDLIYGLPYQTSESFRKTLAQVIRYEPDRLAVFGYAHVPWVAPAQKLLEGLPRPDASQRLKMLIETIEFLLERGYVDIGMDHFARQDDELAIALREGTLQRNFQGYSTRAGCEVLGFGMSAISQSDRLIRQNAREISEWSESLRAGQLPIRKVVELSAEDRLRRDVIMSILCAGRVSYSEIEFRHGIVDFESYFESALLKLQGQADDGLVSFVEGGFEVTLIGRLLLRNIAMPFDAYVNGSSLLTSRHSRTI